MNDLRRLDYAQKQSSMVIASFWPVAMAVVFLGLAAFIVSTYIATDKTQIIVLTVAAVIGGYMALNIGANDVANNMGPAVGGKVISVTTAVLIAAVFESAGALLAGGDVVNTIAKGIITPDPSLSVGRFQALMLSALLAAALWINLATILNAPVSTTHSIVGGVLGAGIAASGFALVNWVMVASIAASWVISPLLGAFIAAALLYAIKTLILNAPDHLKGARRWMPVIYALMACAFTAYMSTKGLKKIITLNGQEILTLSLFSGVIVFIAVKPWMNARINNIRNKKKDLNKLFDVPLIFGVALLSFAHGANDVANAIGPLAAIVSSFSGEVSSKATIPFWVLAVGAMGISLGLLLFGPRLIRTVGQKITRLTAARAYCVALSSAITVLIASSLGLPVSSTHIAIGAIFGVGFLREFLENPNKRKIRPGHKLNLTSKDAFVSKSIVTKRRLVRRNFVYSIAAAWIFTVPASASVAALIYTLLQLL